MYSVDATDAQLLIGYTDVFSGETPNLKEEIGMTTFMEKVYQEACVKMKEMLF